MRRAIIIDDERFSAILLKQKLEELTPIRVMAIDTDSRKIDALMHKYNPHIAFLDINLGEETGLSIAEYLAENYPLVQVVFVTAHEEFALSAFELGAVDYLLKPVTNERLHKMVSNVIKQSVVNKMQVENGLYITSLGNNGIYNKNNEPIKTRTKKAEELFYLLWCSQGKNATREQILAYLWPHATEEQATTSLHSAMYQLRKVLYKEGFEEAIVFRNKRYYLDAPVYADVDQLFEIMEEKNISEAMIRQTLSLYQGDYLAQMDYVWAIEEREVIKQRFYAFLFQHFKKRCYSTRLAEEIIEHLGDDIYMDEAWIKEVLRYYIDTKQRAKLVAFYEASMNWWSDELGIDLPKDIQKIYTACLLEL